jgi:hypothetical protein
VSAAEEDECWGRLRKAFTQPSDEMVFAEWKEGEKAEWEAVTVLKVTDDTVDIPLRGLCSLVEIDMSQLVCLPMGFTMRECLFLERVRLPVEAMEIPDGMFEWCPRLCEVNLGACRRVARIGARAFAGCYDLRGVEVPPACMRVDFRESGLKELDLRGNMEGLRELDVGGCGNLERLMLSRRWCVRLETACDFSMRARLTVGVKAARMRGRRDRWVRPIRSREVRFLSLQGFHLNMSTVCPTGLVFGEVVGLAGREVHPALPS